MSENSFIKNIERTLDQAINSTKIDNLAQTTAASTDKATPAPVNMSGGDVTTEASVSGGANASSLDAASTPAPVNMSTSSEPPASADDPMMSGEKDAGGPMMSGEKNADATPARAETMDTRVHKKFEVLNVNVGETTLFIGQPLIAEVIIQLPTKFLGESKESAEITEGVGEDFCLMYDTGATLQLLALEELEGAGESFAGGSVQGFTWRFHACAPALQSDNVLDLYAEAWGENYQAISSPLIIENPRVSQVDVFDDMGGKLGEGDQAELLRIETTIDRWPDISTDALHKLDELHQPLHDFAHFGTENFQVQPGSPGEQTKIIHTLRPDEGAVDALGKNSFEGGLSYTLPLTDDPDYNISFDTGVLAGPMPHLGDKDPVEARMLVMNDKGSGVIEVLARTDLCVQHLIQNDRGGVGYLDDGSEVRVEGWQSEQIFSGSVRPQSNLMQGGEVFDKIIFTKNPSANLSAQSTAPLDLDKDTAAATTQELEAQEAMLKTKYGPITRVDVMSYQNLDGSEQEIVLPSKVKAVLAEGLPQYNVPKYSTPNMVLDEIQATSKAQSLAGLVNDISGFVQTEWPTCIVTLQSEFKDILEYPSHYAEVWSKFLTWSGDREQMTALFNDEDSRVLTDKMDASNSKKNEHERGMNDTNIKIVSVQKELVEVSKRVGDAIAKVQMVEHQLMMFNLNNDVAELQSAVVDTERSQAKLQRFHDTIGSAMSIGGDKEGVNISLSPGQIYNTFDQLFSQQADTAGLLDSLHEKIGKAQGKMKDAQVRQILVELKGAQDDVKFSEGMSAFSREELVELENTQASYEKDIHGTIMEVVRETGNENMGNFLDSVDNCPILEEAKIGTIHRLLEENKAKAQAVIAQTKRGTDLTVTGGHVTWLAVNEWAKGTCDWLGDESEYHQKMKIATREGAGSTLKVAGLRLWDEMLHILGRNSVAYKKKK